eukprot:s5351_g1.t1
MSHHDLQADHGQDTPTEQSTPTTLPHSAPEREGPSDLAFLPPSRGGGDWPRSTPDRRREPDSEIVVPGARKSKLAGLFDETDMDPQILGEVEPVPRPVPQGAPSLTTSEVSESAPADRKDRVFRLRNTELEHLGAAESWE